LHGPGVSYGIVAVEFPARPEELVRPRRASTVPRLPVMQSNSIDFMPIITRRLPTAATSITCERIAETFGRAGYRATCVHGRLSAPDRDRFIAGLGNREVEVLTSCDLVSEGLDVPSVSAVQFPEDDGPLAHPVRPDSYISIDNFYTPTVYNKGAELVRMIHTLIGKEGFRRGMDLYIAATTIMQRRSRTLSRRCRMLGASNSASSSAGTNKRAPRKSRSRTAGMQLRADRAAESAADAGATG
jgi:hypothetical protein